MGQVSSLWVPQSLSNSNDVYVDLDEERETRALLWSQSSTPGSLLVLFCWEGGLLAQYLSKETRGKSCGRKV